MNVLLASSHLHEKDRVVFKIREDNQDSTKLDPCRLIRLSRSCCLKQLPDREHIRSNTLNLTICHGHLECVSGLSFYGIGIDLERAD